MVSHDPYINPEHCLGPKGEPVSEGVMIRNLTAEEVQKYDCGSKKSRRFPKQVLVPHSHIPKFSEVLDLVKSSKAAAAKKVQLNVESKIYPHHPERSPEPDEFVKLIVAALKKAGLVERATLQSFDDRTLKAAQKQEPRLRRVLLTSDNHFDFVAAAKSDKVYALSPDFEWITADDVKALHKAGIKVIPWTVNDAEGWKKMIDIG